MRFSKKLLRHLKMKIIEAYAGECVSDTVERALQYVKESRDSTCILRHNSTKVFVYRNSCYEDICDKVDMQRRIDQLEQSYRR
jgi:hypothetical protein